jgi:S-adenosylmethionine:tRNA ribosyltransferase-isomerase
MRVDAFDFDLPRDRIAERPARPRDGARLLVVRRRALDDRRVSDLPALLRPRDIVVFNDTRVIPARLVGRRGEARIEVTLHKRVRAGVWRAFARPAKRLRRGQTVRFAEDLAAEVVAREDGEVTLRFDRTGAAFDAALARHGAMPLPPYIARPDGPDERDRADYQTMFAVRPGAVAAPTAGLHFTPRLARALAEAAIERAVVTLHVGAGTFLPVTVADTDDHRMHSESGEIDSAAAAAIEDARARGGRVVAVGTTVLRLLESAGDGGVRPFAGETDLFITPGYRFRAVDLLLTNFHLPRSTVFMLACAFAGLERMRAAYAHALAAGYRFTSYGDACLLDPEAA